MSQVQYWYTALALRVLLAMTTLFLGSPRLLMAQEATEPAPPPPATTVIPTETIPLEPAPSYAERQLTPIPERFRWLQRDVRSNSFLESLADLFLDPKQRQGQFLLALSLSEEYSDNFFHSRENRREEYTTRADLGTLYRFDEGPAFVSLANTLSARYRVQSEESHMGFANLSLNAGYNLPRLSFGLTESFVRDDDTSNESGETASRALSRRRRVFLRNQVSPQVQYAISRLTSVSASYTNIIIQEENGSASTVNPSGTITDSGDSISHAFGAVLRHTFSPFLDASIHYTLTQTDNKTSPDSRTNDAQMQMAYRFTGTTSATIRIFGKLIDRSRSGIDSQSYGLNLGARHALTPVMTMAAAVGPTVLDRDKRAQRVFFNWQASLDGFLSLFQSRDTILTFSTNQDVEDTATDIDNVGLVLRRVFSAHVGHTVSQRLQAALYANYTRTEPIERVTSNGIQSIARDNFWSAGARATYLLTPVISVSAEYRYQQRDSSQESANFDENRLTVSISGNLSVF